MRDDEQEETAADKKPDAIAYFSDDGTVSSTAKEVGTDHLPTYGQGGESCPDVAIFLWCQMRGSG